MDRGWSLPPTMLSTVEGEAVGVMVDDLVMVDIQTKVQHLEDQIDPNHTMLLV